QVRESIEKKVFPEEDQQPGSTLTASIGVATFPGDANDSTDLVRHAEKALYTAKANGKNKVHMYDSSLRSQSRVSASLSGSVKRFDTGSHRVKTENLSLGGVKFASDEALPVGALADIWLRLPDSEVGFEMAVRVLRSEEVRSPGFGWIAGRPQAVGGLYEIAARTVEISKDDLETLTRYLASSSGPD
ncbi:MAG: diguanylate cyclase, partial [Acidobacteriota bacterium]|nr:diguanylate cyclase [Acidobacteriota bacterium]